ncbi:sister chromatid cohesion protein PDS5 [Ruminococcus sp.]|uniref:sister chromatid cohesion protein PDS5 n=1 Tax=Ruminococcus sp. TaxID=41978 RepID=UPI0025E8A242|nr:sister chromatid cohesion protein PDS5 [Ruminococcus sp.]MBQ8966058.1 HEAT repeat domain-containing protein [Ruminococcus sp.]
MNEKELYKELGALTKEKDRWEDSIPSVAALLGHESVKIRAKALWLLGEMGLNYPETIAPYAQSIAAFRQSEEPLLRQRALNALGRIGRADDKLILPWWEDLFRFAEDEEPKVRLSFIWASENIATNSPDLYREHMEVFAVLLDDPDTKVRMEAPEIFRVLGKRRPEFVTPYENKLRELSLADPDRVVRIHSLGALKAAGLA